MPTKKENKIEDWEKEFERLLGELSGANLDTPLLFHTERLKQFIHSLLKAQKTSTLLALKDELEIQMNEIVAGKKLLKSAKLSNWKEDDICIKEQLQALSLVIKLIEKYEK